MEHYPSLGRLIRLKGQAMVEFALVLPLLILIIMGVFDLGRGIYSYNVISNSAREGARYGIVRCDSLTASLPTSERANVKNTAIAKAIGVDPADIAINQDTDIVLSPDCTFGSSLTVTVHYTFHPLTLFFTTLNLVGKATMTIE